MANYEGFTLTWANLQAVADLELTPAELELEGYRYRDARELVNDAVRGRPGLRNRCAAILNARAAQKAVAHG